MSLFRNTNMVDHGLCNYILTKSNYDLGFTIENIVYLELHKRNCWVMIGKVGNTKVDFVAEKQGFYAYIQVTADMTSEETFNREIRFLANNAYNYEKIILTGDMMTVGDYNGIKLINVIDWLLRE